MPQGSDDRVICVGFARWSGCVCPEEHLGQGDTDIIDIEPSPDVAVGVTGKTKFYSYLFTTDLTCWKRERLIRPPCSIALDARNLQTRDRGVIVLGIKDAD